MRNIIKKKNCTRSKSVLYFSLGSRTRIFRLAYKAVGSSQHLQDAHLIIHRSHSLFPFSMPIEHSLQTLLKHGPGQLWSHSPASVSPVLGSQECTTISSVCFINTLSQMHVSLLKVYLKLRVLLKITRYSLKSQEKRQEVLHKYVFCWRIYYLHAREWQSQEDMEFKASLGFRRPCLRKNCPGLVRHDTSSQHSGGWGRTAHQGPGYPIHRKFQTSLQHRLRPWK